MSDAQLALLTQQVLWSAFAVAAVFGALVQRTGFCTMGAVSDALVMGDWTRLRQWALASGVAVLGFAALVQAGQVNPAQTLYVSARWPWLSALVGGVLFGAGMVLASGCASKSLVRLGGGNLKSLVVLLVVGLSGFATLKGVTAVLRTATVDAVALEMASGATLPAVLAGGPASPGLALAVALVAGGALVAWGLASRAAREPLNLLAGAGIGLCVVAMWWVSGSLGHVAEHPQTLQDSILSTNSGRAESLSFVSPIAYTLDWLMFFSDRSKLLTLGIASVAGVVAGAAVSSLGQGSFRWQGFGNVRDLAQHLVGGLFMGIGGVTAMGCSIGHGVSGLATLSLTSLVAVPAMVAGAVAALRWQAAALEREA